MYDFYCKPYNLHNSVLVLRVRMIKLKLVVDWMIAAPPFSQMILKAVVTAPSKGHTSTEGNDRQHIILAYNLKFHLPAREFYPKPEELLVNPVLTTLTDL